jgi:ABC-type polar amino acid transport system ATPase subunit
MIKAKNLFKSIGNSAILKDINLELNKGEINVLFGPSGSGKTTLCRNLSLLDSPDKGEIEILDQKYSFPKATKFDKLPYPKISFVYQQLFLWPHLTNEQNILLALGKKGIPENIEFKELVDFLEIKDILKRYPNEASIGQKQRVAIARALILNPEFIFFDEITSALDIVQTKKIAELIQKLKSKNIGVLLITHNLELFKKIADKLIFLKEGQIMEIGDSNLLETPKTKELITFLT